MRLESRDGRLFIQVSGPSLCFARISNASKSPRLERLLEARCAIGRDANALTDLGVLRQLADCIAEFKLTDKHVTIIVGGLTSACHYIRLPKLDQRQVKNAARLKLANLLPFETSEALIDLADAAKARPAAARVGTDATDSTLCRAATMHLPMAQAMCDAVRGAGLLPTGIVPIAGAIEPLASTLMGPASAAQTALLFIDEFSATALLARAGAVVNAGDLPLALNDLTLALTRPIIDVDRSITLTPEQAVAVRNEAGIPRRGQVIASLGVAADRILPLLEPILQQWTRAITQWLTYAAGAQGASTVRDLVIAGPAANIRGLVDTLSERLQINMRAAAGILHSDPVQTQPNTPELQPVRFDNSPSSSAGTLVLQPVSTDGLPTALCAALHDGPSSGPTIGAAPGEHLRMERPADVDPYELHDDPHAPTSKAATHAVGSDADHTAAPQSDAATAPAARPMPAMMDSLLPMVGVARGGGSVPLLVPPSLRRAQRMERFSRITSICGPAAAAGFVLLTVVFWRAGGGLSSSLASETANLAQVKQQVQRQRDIATSVERVRNMQHELRMFAEGAPRWLGLFKELSRILPDTVFLRQFEAIGPPNQIELRLSAYVQSPDAAMQFDQLIQHSLLALQGSPFFEDVQVVSANRNSGREDWGELEVHMRLVYPGRHATATSVNGRDQPAVPAPARNPLEHPNG